MDAMMGFPVASEKGISLSVAPAVEFEWAQTDASDGYRG